MAKAFDKYILKEIASPFAVGLLVYTFTLLLNMIFLLSERLIAKDVSGMTILQILGYLLPDLLSFTIPMATLMGVLAGLSRMSTDSEIVAFKTMGVNNLRMLKPIMVFSVAAWFVSSIMIMYLAPEANFRLTQLNARIIISKTISDIKSRVFNKDFQPYTIYFNDVDHETQEWRDVFLYSRQKGETDSVILAERGKFLQKPREDDESYILLKNARMHRYTKAEPDKNYECIFYNRLKMKVPELHQVKQNRRRGTQLVFPELVKKRKAHPENIGYAIEFHRRFSLPFACLAMGFLALSLGISTKKGGKISGFIISLGVVFVYYTIITVCRNLVVKKILSPAVGMWAADVFLLVAGLIAYYYTSREKTIDWERMFSFVDRIKKHFYEKEKHRAVKNRKVLVVIKIKRLQRKPLKLLDYYVLKRMVLSFFFVFTSLILIFYLVRIMELVDNIIENKVAFYYLLRYVYFNTPEIIRFVLPVSVLTSVLLTFSVMSKNNEIISVQVSGISLFRLALPALFFGLILSGAYFLVQEHVAPGANRKALKTLDIIKNRDMSAEHELNENWVVGDNNELFFYDIVNQRFKRYVHFNIIYLNKDFSIKRRVSAKYARWINKRELLLEQGFEREFKNHSPVDYKVFASKQVVIEKGKDIFTRKIKNIHFMNIEDLKNYIAYLKNSRSDYRKYKSQLYHKYSFPLSSLVMVFIAIPFSFWMGNKGTLYGIGLAVVISMIFWGAFSIFSALGSALLLPPLLAAFAPLFIFSALSVYLFLHVKT
ncbi:MAG: LPS export ABC transporter permease LptF [bacterium]|nr:LPS export ABC transporter permease LptF [bacterium]